MDGEDDLVEISGAAVPSRHMEHPAGITVAISYGWRSKADEGEGGR